MKKEITRREAMTLGLTAAMGTAAIGWDASAAESALTGENPDGRILSFDPFLAVVPQPKEATISDGSGISPHVLRDCLSAVEDFVPSAAIRVSVVPGDPARHEGYELTVGPSGALIIGNSAAGAFYGIQTLAQIVRAAMEAGQDIPALSIRDWPDIPYRAVHFDVKHHLDTLNAYYDALDRLASLKVNAVIWEFEDKLRYRRRPVIGADNAISIEQMQALTRYARRRHIEISPLVQGLGHASFILKHGEFAELRDAPDNDWAFDPLNERTYQVQFDLYLDAIEATPGSQYLHIGADEVNVGQSAAAQASGQTPLELHLHWLRRVSDFLLEHGRTPIMWDDMPLKHSGVYGTTHDSGATEREVASVWTERQSDLNTVMSLFPPEVVMMRWSYQTPDTHGNHRAIDWYAESGLPVMAATAAQTRWPVFPRSDGNVGSIRTLCGMTASGGLDGILCTAWDDDSPHMAFFWRGWTCFADFSWSADRRSEEEALLAFARQSYGLEAGLHAAAGLRELGLAMDAWDTMLTTANRRNVCWADTMDGVLSMPSGTSTSAWVATHRERIQRANAALVHTATARQAFEAALQTCTRNRFDLRLALALTELQSWSHEVMADLRSVPTKSLETRWAAFLDVYKERRILRNPPGYVLDQNHHAHQANSSNGPEWMIAVELKFSESWATWHANL